MRESPHLGTAIALMSRSLVRCRIQIVCFSHLMYVCIEVALRGVPMGSGVKLGPGEGPIEIVGPMSQPRGTIDTASRTLDHTHARMCVI